MSWNEKCHFRNLAYRYFKLYKKHKNQVCELETYLYYSRAQLKKNISRKKNSISFNSEKVSVVIHESLFYIYLLSELLGLFDVRFHTCSLFNLGFDRSAPGFWEGGINPKYFGRGGDRVSTVYCLDPYHPHWTGMVALRKKILLIENTIVCW